MASRVDSDVKSWKDTLRKKHWTYLIDTLCIKEIVHHLFQGTVGGKNLITDNIYDTILSSTTKEGCNVIFLRHLLKGNHEQLVSFCKVLKDTSDNFAVHNDIVERLESDSSLKLRGNEGKEKNDEPPEVGIPKEVHEAKIVEISEKLEREIEQGNQERKEAENVKVQLEETLKQNHDLQSQIGKLALQIQKGNSIFQSKNGKLKETINVLGREKSDLQDRIKGMSDELQLMRRKESQLADRDSQIAQLQDVVKSKEKSIKTLELQLVDSNNSKENQSKELQKEIKAGKEQNQKLVAQLEDLKSKIKVMEQCLGSQQKEISNLKEKTLLLQRINKQLEETTQQLNKRDEQKLTCERIINEKLVNGGNHILEAAVVTLKELFGTLGFNKKCQKQLDALRKEVFMLLPESKILKPEIEGGKRNWRAIKKCQQIIPPGDMQQRFCAITVTQTGHLAITDLYKSYLYIYDKNGAELGHYSVPGFGTYSLNDIAFNEKSGDIVIADNHWGKIHFYTTTGNCKESISIPGKPQGIAVSPKEEVFMTNKSKHCVFTYKKHPENTSSLQFGSEGATPGKEFSSPQSLAFSPDGLLCVADHNNERVQFFTDQGRFVKSLKMLEGHKPNYLATTRDGHLIVSCTSKNTILIYNIQCEEPELVNQLEGCDSPHGVTVDKDYIIYVCNPYHGIQVF